MFIAAESKTPAALSCDFEKDFCDWRQEWSFDNTDWLRVKAGKTANANDTRGHIGDHTTGVHTLGLEPGLVGLRFVHYTFNDVSAEINQTAILSFLRKSSLHVLLFRGNMATQLYD